MAPSHARVSESCGRWLTRGRGFVRFFWTMTASPCLCRAVTTRVQTITGERSTRSGTTKGTTIPFHWSIKTHLKSSQRIFFRTTCSKDKLKGLLSNKGQTFFFFFSEPVVWCPVFRGCSILPERMDTKRLL